MKTVPAHIRQKMHQTATLVNRVAALSKSIEKWMVQQGLDPEDFRDGCGTSLEELEYGNDVTEELCTRIEASINGQPWEP